MSETKSRVGTSSAILQHEFVARPSPECGSSRKGATPHHPATRCHLCHLCENASSIRLRRLDVDRKLAASFLHGLPRLLPRSATGAPHPSCAASSMGETSSMRGDVWVCVPLASGWVPDLRRLVLIAGVGSEHESVRCHLSRKRHLCGVTSCMARRTRGWAGGWRPSDG